MRLSSAYAKGKWRQRCREVIHSRWFGVPEVNWLRHYTNDIISSSLIIMLAPSLLWPTLRSLQYNVFVWHNCKVAESSAEGVVVIGNEI